MYVVGVAVAIQLVWALPRSSTPSDTADLERAIYSELQTERAVSDVRCTRVAPEAANCVATLADVGRARLTATIDARSGGVSWAFVDSVSASR